MYYMTCIKVFYSEPVKQDKPKSENADFHYLIWILSKTFIHFFVKIKHNITNQRISHFIPAALIVRLDLKISMYAKVVYCVYIFYK